MPLTIGQVLHDRYRIDGLLGQGGMGVVYRATDLRFNSPVAIKENLQATRKAQSQFSREATLLNQLRHPSLPRVSDHFSIPGQGQYLVMDYIEGQDLSQILDRQGRIPETRALAWIDGMLDALEYLHSRRPQAIIHRDVKPANVKIRPDGRLFLVDFGLAKVYDPLGQTTMGARGVTPGFAPLEQYGQGRTDARSDVYSAGATLYAMLTAQTPPEAPKLVTGEKQLVPPRRLNPAVSPGVEAAVLKAMQTLPSGRYQTATEFRAALLRPARPPPPPPPPPPPSPPPRSRPLPSWNWVGVVMALLLVIVAAFVALRSWPPPLPPAAQPPEPTASLAPLATPTSGADESGVPTALPVSPAPMATPSPGPFETGVPTVPPPSSVPAATPAPGPTETGVPTAPPPPPVPTAAPTPEPSPTPVVAPQSKLAAHNKIAFVSSRSGSKQLHMMDPDGGGLQQLTHSGENYGPSWSPDAQWLAFTSTRDGNEEIYVMRVDGKGLRNVTRRADSNDEEPTWSPDGRRLAFVSDRGGNEDVYTIGADGSGLSRLTTSPARDTMPAWSVNGQIAFRSNRNGNNQIYVINAGGSNLYNASRSATADHTPRWSPDGNRIVFKSKVASTMDLFVMNADGSGKTRLTDEFTYLFAADWSPDGRTLVLAMETGCPAGKRKNCNLEIYKMPASGGGMTRLTSDPADDLSPVWSPR